MAVNASIMLTVWIFLPETPDHPSRIQHHKDGSEQANTENSTGKERKVIYKWIVIALVCIFLHTFFGVEQMIGQTLIPFVTYSDPHLNKQTGVLMTSTFKGVETVMSLLCLLYIPYLGNGNSVLLNCIVTLAGSVILLVFGTTNVPMLWIALMVIAVGSTSFYGSTMRYVDEHFRVTGFIAGLISVTITSSHGTFPALATILVERHPMSVPWIKLVSSIVMLLIFVIIMLICCTKLKHKLNQ
jgi:heme/copper-type cytochrome/quinol oxidase subunit 4